MPRGRGAARRRRAVVACARRRFWQAVHACAGGDSAVRAAAAWCVRSAPACFRVELAQTGRWGGGGERPAGTAPGHRASGGRPRRATMLIHRGGCTAPDSVRRRRRPSSVDAAIGLAPRRRPSPPAHELFTCAAATSPAGPSADAPCTVYCQLNCVYSSSGNWDAFCVAMAYQVLSTVAGGGVMGCRYLRRRRWGTTGRPLSARRRMAR